MATRTKHMERSHRNYRNNILCKHGFYTKSIRNVEANRYAKQNRKSLFGGLLNIFKRNKEDK